MKYLTALHVLKTTSGRVSLLWCVLFVLVICVITIPITVSNGAGDSQDTLVYVNVLFRHGERTPDSWSSYPTDPYKNETYKPYGYGRLTKSGKQTIYQLGQSLRLLYDKFLGKEFSADYVYARSTNFKRTKNSLQIVLTSMFPPNPKEMLEDNLLWQPISFEYGVGHDEIGDPFYFCLNYLQSYYEYMYTDEAIRKINSQLTLYEDIRTLTGSVITIPKHACKIYQTLETQMAYGLKLPDWTRNYFPQPLDKTCFLHYEFSTATKMMKKLAGGFFLRKILEDIKSKISGNKALANIKIGLYAAHEVNIAVVLGALNLYYPHIPSYGAALLFELHRMADDSYGVKIVYKTNASAAEKILIIPGCDGICPIDKFESLIQDSIPRDYDVCMFLDEI